MSSPLISATSPCYNAATPVWLIDFAPVIAMQMAEPYVLKKTI